MNKLWSVFDTLYSIMNGFIFFYLLSVSLLYLLFFLIAYNRLKKEAGLHQVEPYKRVKESSFTPPISIIVPAYNEEMGVIGTILSLVTGSGKLDYPEYEVIVVNDGSKDDTLQKVIDRFQMKPIKNKVFQKKGSIETKPIRSVYSSEIYPQLLLIDKMNGGKSDALNAGINLSKYPYFASIDGDTILEPDSFLKIMKPIVENNEQEIFAAGGNVLIANGSTIIQGQMKERRLSRNPLVVMQNIEYMRAFLMGRMGFTRNNLLLIISGAFGVFKTSRVIEAGGYKVNTVGEDMELVVRLQRMNLEKKWGARVEYVADPVCYTEAPENLKYLQNQRIRWHRGLFESIWAHKGMIFNVKYGAIGCIAVPYFLVVELLGPVIEFIGYFAMLVGYFYGRLNIEFTTALFVLMVVYGSFMSMGAVLLEEWRLGKYQRVSELNRLFFFALTESFWYRPIQAYWRARGLIIAVSGKRHGWGEMKRTGVST